MKLLSSTGKLAFAAGLASLAIIAFGPAQSALASGGPPSVTSVAFSGTIESPTITVTGTGFGTMPTNGVAVKHLPGCPGGWTGTDYPNAQLFLADATTVDSPWSAGESDGAHYGDCIGVTISSWSAKKIVFTFGSYYLLVNNGDLYSLHDGDPFVLGVKGGLTEGSVSGF